VSVGDRTVDPTCCPDGDAYVIVEVALFVLLTVVIAVAVVGLVRVGMWLDRRSERTPGDLRHGDRPRKD
jgi:hypothetical protein